MNEWMDEEVKGWVNQLMDGWMENYCCVPLLHTAYRMSFMPMTTFQAFSDVLLGCSPFQHSCGPHPPHHTSLQADPTLGDGPEDGILQGAQCWGGGRVATGQRGFRDSGYSNSRRPATIWNHCNPNNKHCKDDNKSAFSISHGILKKSDKMPHNLPRARKDPNVLFFLSSKYEQIWLSIFILRLYHVQHHLE